MPAGHKPVKITVMGSFVVDLAFRTPALPGWGQTIIGSDFKLGPGGKGSNQAVAGARLGAQVTFITKLGRDPFGDLARQTYAAEGIDAAYAFETTEHPTGGASVIVEEVRGENAIVVYPGACFHITPDEIDGARSAIAASAVFLVQLETNMVAVEYGLKLARAAGVTTILNPAPAASLPDQIYPLCDYITPNESEAAALTGRRVVTLEDAAWAAEMLLSHGVGNAVITLGAEGAFVKNAAVAQHVAAVDAGPVVETTGAGDAFNGGLAVALAEGLDVVRATRFACTVAGISVTRPGTTPAMPQRQEVERRLKKEYQAYGNTR
ncbi:MAG TPA: ribokinase [Terriglobales bacterium]